MSAMVPYYSVGYFAKLICEYISYEVCVWADFSEGFNWRQELAR